MNQTYSKLKLVGEQPALTLILALLALVCLITVAATTRSYLRTEPDDPAGDDVTDTSDTGRIVFSPSISTSPEPKEQAPDDNAVLREFEILEAQVSASRDLEQAERLRAAFSKWKAMSQEVATGLRYREVLTSETEMQLFAGLRQHYPTDAQVEKEIDQLVRNIGITAQRKNLNESQGNEVKQLAQKASATAAKYEACVSILEASAKRCEELVPKHFSLVEAESFYTKAAESATNRQISKLQQDHQTRLAEVVREIQKALVKHKELETELAAERSKVSPALQEALNKSEAAKIKLTNDRQERMKQFDENVKPHRSLLLPFISPGYKQPNNDLGLKNDIDKRPMSYSELASRGMLARTENGLDLFFRTASSRRLNINNDRPLGTFPQMDAGRNSPSQFEQVKLAQKLIREFGPEMVRAGWLSE